MMKWVKKLFRRKRASSEERTLLLIEEMENFLRSGLSSYREYSRLSPDLKAALIFANKKVEIERATRIGLAMQGEIGLAMLRSEISGPDELDQLAVTAALDHYELKHRRR